MNFRRTKATALPIRGECAWSKSEEKKAGSPGGLPVRNNRVTNSLEVQPQSELSETTFVVIAASR